MTRRASRCKHRSILAVDPCPARGDNLIVQALSAKQLALARKCVGRLFFGRNRTGGFALATSTRGLDTPVTSGAPVASRIQERLERLEQAIECGANHLLSLQVDAGYWHGELEADTTLESDYIYYLHILGKADPERIAKLANYVRQRQLPDGGWSIYPGGPSELNATCKAYFALKLAGDSTDSTHMVQARKTVHRLGGLEHTNSYVRFYLALIGAVGWELVPAIPVELMLLPNWCFINIYEMSSWTRGIVIPMAILCALRPGWRLPERARVDELFKDPTRKTAAFDWSKQLLSWKNVFLALDRGLKLYEKLPWKPLRQRALREAKSWMLDHLARNQGILPLRNRGRRHHSNAALRFAGLGYLHRHGFARGSRPSPRSSRAGQSRGLDAFEAGPRPRRLANQKQRRRARRLGVRIPQRFLSRCRRHRLCPDGAPARKISRSNPHGRRHSPRHPVASQHAESRWRLGRLRSRQRPRVPLQHSVRRPQ